MGRPGDIHRAGSMRRVEDDVVLQPRLNVNAGQCIVVEAQGDCTSTDGNEAT